LCKLVCAMLCDHTHWWCWGGGVGGTPDTSLSTYSPPHSLTHPYHILDSFLLVLQRAVWDAELVLLANRAAALLKLRRWREAAETSDDLLHRCVCLLPR
jgi:hypothetical protein